MLAVQFKGAESGGSSPVKGGEVGCLVAFSGSGSDDQHGPITVVLSVITRGERWPDRGHSVARRG